ncbi:MAG: hemolysin [Flavobacteriaceae bacterium TMED200]|nr:hemolysin [Flavobacteriaceae bacterium]OUW66334.1 MAG: hemolysin [Flavobacteriaceae bacterium TMED200]
MINDAVIVICLIMSAFFSGMEIAFISCNRVFLEIEKNKKGIIAKVLKYLTYKPSKFITTMLVGNNFCLVIYGIFMGDKIIQILFSNLNTGPLPLNILFIQTLISTFIILITAEFLPKVFFQLYANQMVKFFAIPSSIFYTFFMPISLLILKITDTFLKFFSNSKSEKTQLTFSKNELGEYIEEQVEAVENKDQLDSEIEFFQNALEFSETKVREVMIPRAEIIGINKSENILELSSMFESTGYSKIPVYDENIDDVIGFVHAFEMLKKPNSISEILIPIEYVHEPNLITDVLKKLTIKRKTIAVVLDEYGGTAGLLTVEDIIEELFGEIEDEYDIIEHYEKKINVNSFEFSARLEIDYLMRKYKLNLPQDENYETLGGLIFHLTGEIPQKDTTLLINDLKIKVISVLSNKIEKVAIKKVID